MLLAAPMPIDDEDLQRLRAHYAQHAKAGSATCPICGGTSWTADGPVAVPTYVADFGVMDTNKGVPMMLLICGTCFFVRHFAWNPISGEPSDG
jgi:hypothetical protein